MNDARLYLKIALFSQVISSVVFIGVLVFMWFRWILPVVMAAQKRSNRRIAEAERHRDEVKGALEALRDEIRPRTTMRTSSSSASPRASNTSARRRCSRRARRANAPSPTLRSRWIGLAPRRECGCATTWWRPPFASLATTRSDASVRRPDARFVDELTPGRSGKPRMVSQTLARRYAVAIASVARDQNAVERVGDDLAAAARAIGEKPMVAEFFVAPVIDRPEKERVLNATFEGRVHTIALHSLLLLVQKRRERLLAGDRRRVSNARARGTGHGDAHPSIGTAARPRRVREVDRAARNGLRQKIRGYRDRRSRR